MGNTQTSQITHTNDAMNLRCPICTLKQCKHTNAEKIAKYSKNIDSKKKFAIESSQSTRLLTRTGINIIENYNS